jgi:hypothetical protein
LSSHCFFSLPLGFGSTSSRTLLKNVLAMTPGRLFSLACDACFFLAAKSRVLGLCLGLKPCGFCSPLAFTSGGGA